MNKIASIILWLLILINLNCSTTIQKEIEFKQEAMTLQTQNKQQNPIMSKDSTIARQALDKAILNKDKATIQLGLTKNSLIFKKDVVRAIEQLNDKSFVPDLIKSLEDNQVEMGGGTETKFLQKELDKAIVSALKKITELDFSANDRSSDDNIQEVLRKSREWWEVYQWEQLPDRKVK